MATDDLAGADYGLAPQLDHTPPVIYSGSRDILTNPNDYQTGSQYGGTPGLVQPYPHIPTASERLHQVYAISPTDDGSYPDSVAVPELEGEFFPR